MPDGLRVDGVFLVEGVVRDVLRGDLAADVLAVLDAVLFDVVDRPERAVRDVPPVLLLPLAAVFDRADAVLRDEVDLELPLLDEPLLLPPRDDVLLLLLRDDEPLLPPPLLLRPVLFLAELLRLDELLLRPPLELFRDEDEPPLDDLRFVAAAPFLPAVLFFADELRDEPLDERELEPDFFEPLEDFFELEPEDFFEPPDEDRDDDELFFEPPLLLELDDEREPLDFLVVAMQIIPPIVFGMFLHKYRSAICVPFELCIKSRQLSYSFEEWINVRIDVTRLRLRHADLLHPNSH